MAKNIPILKWKRPDSIEYPKIWHRFRARDLNSDNLVEYRIEDLTEDRFQDAMKHMRDNYLMDEPVSQGLGGYNDPNHFEDYAFGWKAIIAQKTPIVCYKEGSNEIVAVNWTFVSTKEDSLFEQILANSESPITKFLFGAALSLYDNFNLYERYGVDKFMGSLALSVDKRYRGRRIGDQMLSTRKILCQAFGIKLTHTLFSSDYSNRNADNVGFQLDVSKNFDELQKLYPEYDLSSIKCSALCLKSLRY